MVDLLVSVSHYPHLERRQSGLLKVWAVHARPPSLSTEECILC